MASSFALLFHRVPVVSDHDDAIVAEQRQYDDCTGVDDNVALNGRKTVARVLAPFDGEQPRGEQRFSIGAYHLEPRRLFPRGCGL